MGYAATRELTIELTTQLPPAPCSARQALATRVCPCQPCLDHDVLEFVPVEPRKLGDADEDRGIPVKISQAALEVPRLGSVNMHPALLPRHRGPIPLAWALRDGDTVWGQTWHRMDAELDTGNLLVQGTVPIEDEDVDIWVFGAKLIANALTLLPRALERIAAGDPGDPQPLKGASWAGHFEDDDYARIDWAQSARAIHNQVRAWHLTFGLSGIRAPIAELDGEASSSRWCHGYALSLVGASPVVPPSAENVSASSRARAHHLPGTASMGAAVAVRPRRARSDPSSKTIGPGWTPHCVKPAAPSLEDSRLAPMSGLVDHSFGGKAHPEARDQLHASTAAPRTESIIEDARRCQPIDPGRACCPAIRLSDAIAHYIQTNGVSLGAIAHRARVSPTRLQLLADGDSNLLGPAALETVAGTLGLSAGRLREYRLAVVLDSLSSSSERLEEVFLVTLSPIERALIGDAKFSNERFGPSVWRLLAEHEMTQQELAEGIGVDQSNLSRIMNGHERLSIDLLETIAQALDAAPEVFVEYRLALIDEWLQQHPERLDQLFDELNEEPLLAEYDPRRLRRLPSPLDAGPRGQLESLVEIVGVDAS
jgi:transcriptional regulator with XRE-family HTH domain